MQMRGRVRHVDGCGSDDDDGWTPLGLAEKKVQAEALVRVIYTRARRKKSQAAGNVCVSLAMQQTCTAARPGCTPATRGGGNYARGYAI